MTWFKSSSVTANTGSRDVIVNGAELIDSIRDHDALLIEGFSFREIKRAYTDEQTSVKIIELVEPWPHANQIEVSCQVLPTASYFDESIQALNAVRDKIIINWTPLLAFGNQQTGTVTFASANSQGQDVTIRCLNQFATDIGALEQSAIDATEDLQAVDSAINAEGGLDDQVQMLSLIVSGIDSTLQGYVAAASGHASDANDDKLLIDGWRVTISGQHSDISGWYSQIDSWQQFVDQKATEAANSAQAAADSAALAGSFEGGNASALGSIPAESYFNDTNHVPTKAQVGLSNVDNTSDADKEISIATQNALDLKADISALSNYATQSELADVRKLALLGL